MRHRMRLILIVAGLLALMGVAEAFGRQIGTCRTGTPYRFVLRATYLEEETFREYPESFREAGLPLLTDHGNYWSGRSGDMFWHQNSDNVFVFIPLGDDMNKRNINVDFQALGVEVTLPGKDTIKISCLERLIPDGSFWIIEEDKQGNRYLHLDLEKRFRMINWKSLFGEPPAEDSDADEIEKRSQMLEKLFAANKGMAKMTGQEPESMQEMMENEDLVRMMADKIYGPEVMGVEDGEGNRLDEILADLDPDFDVNSISGVSMPDNDDDNGDDEEGDDDDVIDVEAS